jgi:hypothetical protein
MTKKHQRIADPDIKPLKHEGNREHGENEDAEANCRCKEGKEKTFPQLLKQMLKDLTFWKK